jgi:hypothetical protein
MGLVVEEINGQEKVKAESREEYTPYHPQRGYGWAEALPARQGLYDPQLEKDACGVGFAALVSSHFPLLFSTDLLLQPYQGQSKPQDCQRW